MRFLIEKVSFEPGNTFTFGVKDYSIYLGS